MAGSVALRRTRHHGRPPGRDRRRGHRPRAAGPAPLLGPDREGEPAAGRLPAAGHAERSRPTSSASTRSFRASKERVEPARRAALGRRAADVRDRARAHEPPAAPPHRRAVPRARAARRGPPARPHHADQRGGHDRAPRRAGRPGRPRARAPRLRPRDGPHRPVRTRRRAPRRPAHPAGVPRASDGGDGAGLAPTAAGRALLALFFATVAVFADLYVTQPILPLLSQRVRRARADGGAHGLGRRPHDRARLERVGPARGRLRPQARDGRELRAARRPDVPLRRGADAPGPRPPARRCRASSCRASRPSPWPTSATSSPARALGPAVGGWVAASVLGGLTGRVGSGWIASHFSWRAPFLVFGAVTLVAALGDGAFLPRLAAPGPAVSVGLRVPRDGWAPPEPPARRRLPDRRLGVLRVHRDLHVPPLLPHRRRRSASRRRSISAVYLVYGAGVLTSVARRADLSGRFGRRALMADRLPRSRRAPRSSEPRAARSRSSILVASSSSASGCSSSRARPRPS